MYDENLFQFQLRDSYWPWENKTTRKDRLESLCQELYHDTVEVWIEKAFEARIRSDLAVFLRQIGRQKAATVKRLKFLKNENTCTSPEAKQAGWAIEVVTQLLKCYAPGVRQIKICRVAIPVFGLKREDCVHWDVFENGPFEANHHGLKTLEGMRLSPPLWGPDDAEHDLKRYRPDSVRLEEEEAVHQAVLDMVQEITWLNYLRVTGDDGIRLKVEDLQTLVKNRN